MPTASSAGGRTSRKKFGDEPNSVANTLNLPGSDRVLQIRFAENSREYDTLYYAMEAWAKAGFVSGYSVINTRDGDV